jgi:hypothetical protein
VLERYWELLSEGTKLFLLLLALSALILIITFAICFWIWLENSKLNEENSFNRA